MKVFTGLEVTTKSVERTAEGVGADIAQRERGEMQKALRLDLPVGESEPIPILAEKSAPPPVVTSPIPVPASQPVRRSLPEHLPRETHRHEPAEQTCPGCGGSLRPLVEDISEMLEYVPAYFKVPRQVRPNRRATCARSWHASPTIPSTASRISCSGI